MVTRRSRVVWVARLAPWVLLAVGIVVRRAEVGMPGAPIVVSSPLQSPIAVDPTGRLHVATGLPEPQTPDPGDPCAYVWRAAGYVAAVVVPPGVGLTVGAILAGAALPWVSAAGHSQQVLAPLEGVCLALSIWPVPFLMGAIGVRAGNLTRRPAVALVVALVAGLPALAFIAYLLPDALLFPRLGSHLLLIAGTWLAGRAFASLGDPRHGEDRWRTLRKVWHGGAHDPTRHRSCRH